jgi:hypothetical protein
MRIILYFDEDSQENDLIQALRLREAKVYSSAEAGLNGRTDEEQLTFAAAEGYVLYSYNSRDFYHLHTQFLAAGKTHAGIILGPQQQYSVGEQMRRLLKIIGAKSAEEMQNQVEFLGVWGE